MSNYKSMRLRRILDPNKHRSVMFACSHGTSAPQVLKGIEDPLSSVRYAIEGGANVVFLSLGVARRCVDLISKYNSVGLALKVSASACGAEKPFLEVPIASVQTALEIGADAVVALVPFAPSNEPDVISWVAKLGEECHRWAMPFIAEAEFPNAYTEEQSAFTKSLGEEYLKRSARLCAELGADIVKSNWPGNPEAFEGIVRTAGVPVIVAGGSKVSDLDLLQRLEDAIKAGAVGCSVGRNIFQHKDPVGMTRAICAVVRDGMSPEEAIQFVSPEHRDIA